MGRGKIEIKKIENPTNRQVTYSKRKNGIFKKAQELSVLCDAQVSLIMFSSTNRLHEYISPTTTTKKTIDRYQHTTGIDIWSTHYQNMQENLRQLKEINMRLRRDIRQRLGEDLDDLNFRELHRLELKMQSAVDMIRNRKLHVIKTQTDKYKKKVRNLEERRGNLMVELEAKLEEEHGLVIDNGGDYESKYALANGASNLYAFHLYHDPCHLHRGAGIGDLRLA